MVLAGAWWLLSHEIGLAVLFVLAAVTLYDPLRAVCVWHWLRHRLSD